MQKKEPEGINVMNTRDKEKTEHSLSNFKIVVY